MDTLGFVDSLIILSRLQQKAQMRVSSGSCLIFFSKGSEDFFLDDLGEFEGFTLLGIDWSELSWSLVSKELLVISIINL